MDLNSGVVGAHEFRTLAREAADLLGASCGLVLARDGGFETVASHGAPASACALMAQFAAAARARGRSLPRAAESAPTAPQDVDAEVVRHLVERAVAQDGAMALDPGCLALFPLSSPDEAPGYLAVLRLGAGARPLARAELHLAGQFAARFSLALEQQKLREQVREAQEESARASSQLAACAAQASESARLLAEAQDELASRERVTQRLHRELTERLQTEEVLRRGFLEAAPDAVLIANAAGEIILVNSEAEALFGYSRAELVGQAIELLVPARHQARHPGHRRRYMTAPSRRPVGAGMELFAVRKDGSEFAAEISLSPISTPDGLLVAAAVRDVTERRRDMEERNRRMQEANRLKSEFLANMSHELRTPLNAIIGFAALMHAGKAGPMADVHKEYLGDILNSSRHLLQLINDVLDLAKVEAGRMEVQSERVEIARVVSEVKDILRGLAADKHITLHVHLDADLPFVSVDPRLLKQVLYNLLSNALKFTHDGGQVTLCVKAEGPSMFRVDVADTGIGIRPEDMGRLFIEFQQLDPGKAKKYPGTGLGLVLTKRIVEAQGGQVSVESTHGKGSTFSALFPREVRSRERGASLVPARPGRGEPAP